MRALKSKQTYLTRLQLSKKQITILLTNTMKIFQGIE